MLVSDRMSSTSTWRLSPSAKINLDPNVIINYSALRQQDVIPPEERPVPDPSALDSYFEFLINLAHDTIRPMSIGEIATKLHLSGNRYFPNMTEILDKIPLYNLEIADGEDLRNDVRVKLLYLTQTPLDLPTRQKIRRISKPPMGLILDDDYTIVKFVPGSQKFGPPLHRENETKGHSDLNPIPWSYAEVEDLLEFVRDKTCEDLMFSELKIRCSQYKFSSNSRHNVDQLNAKAFQYIANGLGPMFGFSFREQVTMFFFLKISPNRTFWMELYKQCKFQADENGLLTYCALRKYVLGTEDKSRALSIPGEQIFTFLNIVATTRFLPLTMEELADEFLIMFPNYNQREEVIKEFQNLTYKDVTKKINDGVLQIRVFFVTQIPVSKAHLTSLRHYGKIIFRRMRVAYFETPLKDLVLKKLKMVKIPGGKPKVRATKAEKRQRSPSPGVVFKKSPRRPVSAAEENESDLLSLLKSNNTTTAMSSTPRKDCQTAEDFSESSAFTQSKMDANNLESSTIDLVDEEAVNSTNQVCTTSARVEEAYESDSDKTEKIDDEDENDDEHIDVETISSSGESDVEEVFVNDNDYDGDTGNVQFMSNSNISNEKEVPVNDTNLDGHTGNVQVQVPMFKYTPRETRALPGTSEPNLDMSNRDSNGSHREEVTVTDTNFDDHTGNVQVQIPVQGPTTSRWKVGDGFRARPSTNEQNVDNRPTTNKRMILTALQIMLNKPGIDRAYKLNDRIDAELRQRPIKFEDEISTSLLLDITRTFYRLITRNMSGYGTLDTLISLHTVFRAFEDLLKTFQSPLFDVSIVDAQALRRLSAIHAFKIKPNDLSDALWGMVREILVK
ncbi:hypothetical protein CAEBREN_06316 [Caenorhabditis brenneri]|uniref:SPK domain-containing protein n=1 Tax=Caenorhabditis brenneri TaxID=135651 RepID=G0N211_CAEBE|nr:hypothetical protein CAEBREN_06316 [Caenorhabditis brenneri]